MHGPVSNRWSELPLLRLDVRERRSFKEACHGGFNDGCHAPALREWQDELGWLGSGWGPGAALDEWQQGQGVLPEGDRQRVFDQRGQHGDRPTVAPEVACGGPARPIGQRSCRWHAPEPSRGPGGPVGRRRRSPGLLPTSAATVLPSNVLLVGRPFARPTGDHGWALAITDLGSAAAGPVSLRSAPAPSAHDAHQRPYGRPRRNAATPRGSRGGPGSDAKGPPGLACGW